MLVPINTLKIRLGIDSNGRVQKFFSSTCAKHMDKYVPDGDTLVLRTNKVVKTDSVIYKSPYAHYMWQGDVMGPNIPIKKNGVIQGWFSPKGQPKHYTGAKIQYHGAGGPHWEQRMWSAEKNDVIREVERYMRNGN